MGLTNHDEHSLAGSGGFAESIPELAITPSVSGRSLLFAGLLGALLVGGAAARSAHAMQTSIATLDRSPAAGLQTLQDLSSLVDNDNPDFSGPDFTEVSEVSDALKYPVGAGVDRAPAIYTHPRTLNSPPTYPAVEAEE